MGHLRLALLATSAGAALAAPAAASAASFPTPTPLAGFGSHPGNALVQASALFDDGRSAVVGFSDDRVGSGTETLRVAAAFGRPGALPGAATRFGPTGPYDLDADVDRDGLVSSTWSVGQVAYLSRCSDGGCAPTVRVGTSSLKPQSSVAVQPGDGRTLVMWRGRTASKGLRLQWRVTTGSKLGAVHTLGEGGTSPQLATDASGRTVAIWRGGDGALRTASRRRGEFTRPTTIGQAPGASTPQLVVNATTGRWTAAWLTAPTPIDAEDPAGTVVAASRTNGTAFGTAAPVGPVNAFSLSAAPGGSALLTAQRGTTGATVLAARSTGGAFGALEPIGTAPSLSTTYPPRGAVDDAGDAVVSWSTGTLDPAAPSGTFAATTVAPGGRFAAPQQLSADPSARPTAPSVGRGIAQVAFGSAAGPQVTRAPF